MTTAKRSRRKPDPEVHFVRGALHWICPRCRLVHQAEPTKTCGCGYCRPTLERLLVLASCTPIPGPHGK